MDSKVPNEIQICLKTNLPDDFKISEVNIAIKSQTTKAALNQMVKSLLKKQNKDAARNFQFFIHGNIISDTVLSAVPLFLQSALGEETTDIFYHFELEQPTPQDTIKQDEWIRKIAVSQKHFAVCLFNGEVNFYDTSKNRVATLKANDGFVNDCLFNGKQVILAMREDDYLLKIYQMDFEKGTNSLIYYVQKGQEEVDFFHVNVLSFNPLESSEFVSGDSMGNVYFYRIADEPAGKNKRKTVQAGPISGFASIKKAHFGEITCVKWLNNLQIATGGEDWYVKIFNIKTGSNYCSFNCNYNLPTCLGYRGANALLVGLDNGEIKEWDDRTPSKAVRTFRTDDDNRMVASLSSHPLINNVFVSTTYSGKMKMWDARANKPLFEVAVPDSNKLYCGVYNGTKEVLTGGDNGELGIYKVE